MFRRGWRSRPRGGRGRKRFIWFFLLVLLLSFVQTFIFIEKNLRPPLMNLAKTRLKQIATQSINTAIAERIAQGTNFDKLIDWKTDNNGKVTGFMLNYNEHMRITSDTIRSVQALLKDIGSRSDHIPLGMAMNSAIFASFGPDIPIRLEPAGAVKVDLHTRYEDAGINMVLVEVYIRIIVELRIIVPYDSESEIVETELPISYLLVVGDTPLYYYDNKGNPVGSSSALPPGVTLPNLPSPNGSIEDSSAAAGNGVSTERKSGTSNK